MPQQTDWRVGHTGRDSMFYEELHEGDWLRLPIDGEMLVDCVAHHVIYLDSERRWQSYPDWARGRRAQIVARIMASFTKPQYEYQLIDT
jgi:hypothetical protein